MTDQVGVIATNTNTAVATHTLYTVPTGKALIFKPQYACQANGGAVSTLELVVNGVSIFKSGNITAGNYAWSSNQAMLKTASGYPNGQAKADTVAPASDANYYASAGQTISMIIGSNAMQSMNMQLVGSLIDLS